VKARGAGVVVDLLLLRACELQDSGSPGLQESYHDSMVLVYIFLSREMFTNGFNKKTHEEHGIWKKARVQKMEKRRND
jgi:hypothetical protein